MEKMRKLRTALSALLVLVTVVSLSVFTFAEEADTTKTATKIVWNNPTTQAVADQIVGGYKMSVTLTDINNNPITPKTLLWSAKSSYVPSFNPTTSTFEQGKSENYFSYPHVDSNRSYSVEITIIFEGDELYEATSATFSLKLCTMGPPIYRNVMGSVSAVKNNPEDNILNSGFKLTIEETSYMCETDENGNFKMTVDMDQEFFDNNLGIIEISKPGYLSRKVSMRQFINSSTQDSIKMLPGDINNDESINMTDVMELAAVFGSAESGERYRSVCDLNNDKIINFADVMILAKNFAKTPLDYKGLDPYFLEN
ncbi:MAG: dockerin type I domain-containing protein [Bacillota bacterium]|nr:dockerin type I domain-containing protein [Bacillota bacterium]